LIVSELVTNAARHAFHNGGGVIRVGLLPSKTCVECRISDNGSGEENISPGRGLQIVHSLTKSLDGSIVHRFGPQGVASLLSFPVSPWGDRNLPAADALLVKVTTDNGLEGCSNSIELLPIIKGWFGWSLGNVGPRREVTMASPRFIVLAWDGGGVRGLDHRETAKYSPCREAERDDAVLREWGVGRDQSGYSQCREESHVGLQLDRRRLSRPW
jgi:hypothetical protein